MTVGGKFYNGFCDTEPVVCYECEETMLADILTLMRVVCGVMILFFPAFSGWFYGLYLWGGFTDAIDGTVARKMNTAGKNGEKLDTAADIIFFGAVIAKIVLSYAFPSWVTAGIIIIAAIKCLSIFMGLFRHRRFIAVHSILNKVTGIILFAIPLIIGCPQAEIILTAVFIIALITAAAAAFEELILVYKGEAKD